MHRLIQKHIILKVAPLNNIIKTLPPCIYTYRGVKRADRNNDNSLSCMRKACMDLSGDGYPPALCVDKCWFVCAKRA